MSVFGGLFREYKSINKDKKKSSKKNNTEKHPNSEIDAGFVVERPSEEGAIVNPTAQTKLDKPDSASNKL